MRFKPASKLLTWFAINDTPSSGVTDLKTVNDGASALEVPSESVRSSDLMHVNGPSSTTFQDDGAAVMSATRSTIGLGDLGPIPFDRNEIADFMAKPVLVANGTMSTTDSSNTTLFTGSIANMLFSQQIWYRKLAGYNLVRATAHVKVVVNANPFQQGRMILTFIPCYEHLNSTEKAARNVTLAQITTQPNMELDIADSTMEMAIPYVTPTYYYNRTLGIYDWGSIFLKVLSPLKTGSGGQLASTYSVFLYFTDVELAAPRYGPESSKTITKKKVRNYGILQKEEETQARTGVVSTTLSAISNFADKAKDLPLVGGYAGILSGVASTASDVASFFGWSKPLNVQDLQPMVQRPFKFLHHSTGSSDSTVLGLSNAVTVEPVADFAGSKVDEMSISFLKAIPAYVGSHSWSVSNVHGDLLINQEISPVLLLDSSTKFVAGRLTSYRTGVPMFMLAQLFDLYRGGIELTLKFVKTDFHNGRLSISFTPNSDILTFAQSVYVLREIIDLRTAKEITFKIPYLPGRNYLSTGFGQTISTGGNSDTKLGTLAVRVLDPLRAPETVSQTLEILMYAKPAEDFELAVPIGSKALPFSPEAALEMKPFSRKRRHWVVSDYSPESGLSSVVNTTLQSKALGDSSIPEMSLDYNRVSIGDPITSIKQMLTASRRVYMTVSPGSSTLNVNPSGCVLSSVDGGTGQIAGPGSSLWGDYINFLTTAYAFCRGGYRFTNAAVVTSNTRAYLLPETTDTVAIDSTLPATVDSSTYSLIDVDIHCGPIAAYRTSNTCGVDFSSPHYGRTHIRLNRFQSGANPFIRPAGAQLPDSYAYRIGMSGMNAVDKYWTRSGTDDFCVGYFIGFMPMAASNVLIP